MPDCTAAKGEEAKLLLLAHQKKNEAAVLSYSWQRTDWLHSRKKETALPFTPLILDSKSVVVIHDMFYVCN